MKPWMKTTNNILQNANSLCIFFLEESTGANYDLKINRIRIWNIWVDSAEWIDSIGARYSESLKMW